MDQVISEVDALAAPSRLSRLEDVALVELASQRLQLAGAGAVTNEAANLVAVRQQAAGEPAADESGRPGYQ